jgi:DNA-binding transcriptional LysR family regulator
MEVVGLTSAWAMARAGIGATILPLQFVDSDSFDKNVKLFSIKDNTFTRQPAIVTRRGQYLPEYAKYAISLLTGTTE